MPRNNGRHCHKPSPRAAAPRRASTTNVKHDRTPHVQKMLIWPSSTHGMGLHTRNTSLTLFYSLHVKWLTRKCYVWNHKDYKPVLNPLTTTPHMPHGPTTQLLTGPVWSHRHAGLGAPRSCLTKCLDGGCCPVWSCTILFLMHAGTRVLWPRLRSCGIGWWLLKGQQFVHD